MTDAVQSRGGARPAGNVLILLDSEILEFPAEQVQAARERGRALVRDGHAVDHGVDGLPEPLVDAERLAALLDVPASHVYAQARSGKWPCVKVGDRYVRFQASEVLALLRCPARSR
jgi:predicted DNA-binding transcriptional regulator AlpA